MNSESQVVDSNDQVFITALLSRAKEQLKEDLHGFSTNKIVKATCLVSFFAILYAINHGSRVSPIDSCKFYEYFFLFVGNFCSCYRQYNNVISTLAHPKIFELYV